MKTSNRAVQAIDELDRSGFTEVVAPARAKSEMDVVNYEIEDRLKNWARVVGAGCRSGGNCSSAWAADYIANRNSRDFKLALCMGMIQPRSVMQEIELQVFSEADRIDGWLIESVWTLLAAHEHKQALRFKYVFGWRDDLIRRKLRLRGRENLRLILWRAKTSMQQALDKLKTQAIIQPYNLTAGVPCLKSVPQGGLVTTEEVEALID
jgi:hypothetical protein